MDIDIPHLLEAIWKNLVEAYITPTKRLKIFRSLPMPLLAGGELARRMVDRLYAATTIKEAHLCTVALRSLVEADIECSAFAEQAEEPILKIWSRKAPLRWPKNAAGRR